MVLYILEDSFLLFCSRHLLRNFAYTSQLIRQSLLFIWWFYRQREATHYKACWSRLYAWKIEDLLSNVLWSIHYDLVQNYNTPLSQCDLVICWCVLHTPDLISSDMTGYTLDSTASSWPHQVRFTLPGHLFIHLSFPCCLECNIYPRVCYDYGLMVFLKLTDGGRQFPSLYFGVTNRIKKIFRHHQYFFEARRNRYHLAHIFCVLKIHCCHITQLLNF